MENKCYKQRRECLYKRPWKQYCEASFFTLLRIFDKRMNHIDVTIDILVELLIFEENLSQGLVFGEDGGIECTQSLRRSRW